MVLVLGLLATIAIPAFFNQRLKAQDAEAKSTAKTAATALETYATTNSGSYVAADRAKLKAIEPTLSSAASGSNTITTLTVVSNSYTITVTSDSANTFSIVRATDGSITYPCATGARGGCPSGSSWG